jgi:hypothetical protein
MNIQDIKDEWPVLDENDPPHDLSREEAAYQRQRERLVRNHLGHIALIHGDEVVGVYATLSEAETDGYGRFGNARLIFRSITETDEPEFIPHVDITHPSFQRLE